jgi:hypothetical protein
MNFRRKPRRIVTIDDFEYRRNTADENGRQRNAFSTNCPEPLGESNLGDFVACEESYTGAAPPHLRKRSILFISIHSNFFRIRLRVRDIINMLAMSIFNHHCKHRDNLVLLVRERHDEERIEKTTQINSTETENSYVFIKVKKIPEIS